MNNVSTLDSGKDGFFDLTHVGTGERMKVQESWAKYYPIMEEDRDCVVAYLGKGLFINDVIIFGGYPECC